MKKNNKLRFKEIKKHKFFLITCLFLSLIVLFLSRELYFKANSKKLNLIILSIDTLRPDHMGVYGYKKNTTPKIDNFSKKATVFTNVSTVVPMTHPSFAALITGYDMFQSRIISNRSIDVSPNTKTLATRLKESGYKTIAFVSDISALKQGFDTFNIYSSYFLNDTRAGEDAQTGRVDYEKFFKSAQKWIAENKNNKFFTWIHLMNPHAPYFPPKELKCKFNAKYCLQIQEMTLQKLDNLRYEKQKCQNGEIPPSLIEMMETLYDGEVATADRLIGDFLNTLKKNGLDNNTIVVIYGDHGEGFDHNYYFDHREVLYNSATQIPLIIYDPLRPRRVYSDRLLQNTDILPTILDLLQIPYENTFSGKSVAPLFYPFSSVHSLFLQPRKYSFSTNSSWTKFSISDGKYKYILSLPESCLYKNQQEELYDIKKDWNETINIVNSNKKEGDRLRSVLLEHLSQYNLPQVAEQDNNPVSNKNNESRQKVIEDLRSLQY